MSHPRRRSNRARRKIEGTWSRSFCPGIDGGLGSDSRVLLLALFRFRMPNSQATFPENSAPLTRQADTKLPVLLINDVTACELLPP